jgi:hypothetical protein
MIADKAPEYAAELKRAATKAAFPHGVTAGPPVQNFYGGVHIKQDFRDNDPDRIALMFRKDLSKQAASRTVSRQGTPFGY